MLGANGVLLLTLLLYAAIIYGVVRLIKYLIRYGIDYYFKKLDARQTEHKVGCLSFAACCVALTALFLLRSTWLTEAFSAVLSALCLFTPFEEFVNNNFSIPTLVYYLTVAGLFLFFTAQGLEKRRWN